MYYKEEKLRNQSFELKKHTKVKNLTLNKLKFEISPADSPKQAITNLFQEILFEFGERNKIPDNKKGLLKARSMEVLSVCSQKLQSVSISMESGFEADAETLQWFLFFEILFFMVYKFPDLDSETHNSLLKGIAWHSFEQFSEKLNFLNLQTRVFVIDMLWQEFFYDSQEKVESFSTIARLFLAEHENLIVFEEEEANIELITNILCCQKIKDTFSPYLNVNSEENFREKIVEILQNTFMTRCSEGNHGVTLMNKSIVIDSKKVFRDTISNSGYRLVILIHEISHHVVRSQLNSFQSCLEYSSRESSFAEPSEVKILGKNPESGFQAEKNIFGSKITRLHTEGANFLMSLNNWNIPGFVKKFKSFNKQSEEDRRNNFNGVRMRKADTDQNYVDLSGNWCMTSFHKHRSSK